MQNTDYSNLSKAERKRLKRERKEQEREMAQLERHQKGKINTIRNYSILILVILSIAAFFYWKSIPLKNAPIIDITPDNHNFGMVSQAQGVVSTMMAIQNVGTEDLVIHNLDTSCGCTSASIIYKEVEGPKFGMSMHGTNPKNYRQVIPPGETANLRVYYDPNVHKDMRGAVTRSVSIFSNDPRHKQMEVKISAIQTN